MKATCALCCLLMSSPLLLAGNLENGHAPFALHSPLRHEPATRHHDAAEMPTPQCINGILHFRPPVAEATNAPAPVGRKGAAASRALADQTAATNPVARTPMSSPAQAMPETRDGLSAHALPGAHTRRHDPHESAAPVKRNLQADLLLPGTDGLPASTCLARTRAQRQLLPA